MIRRQREYALQALARYWPLGEGPIRHLALPCAQPPEKEPLPPQLMDALLPDWASDLGVDGSLLVPSAALTQGGGEVWRRVDWLWAAFWFLGGSAERAWEEAHGPVHSYAFRLRGWDGRMWRHAWVNRMALFLRRWAARRQGQEEDSLLGPSPQAEIILTHDVDAIRKTWAIRIKQGAFCFFNSLRALMEGRGVQAAREAGRGLRFLFSRDEYWCFDTIIGLEADRGLRSLFLFYAGAGDGGGRLQKALMDPSYDIGHPRLAGQLARLRQGGWPVGLHGSFASWDDAKALHAQRLAVEQALGATVTRGRQHWLRFGWERTWRVQSEAGLKLDATLGFNDRPGLRTGAALVYRPWDQREQRPHDLEVLPTMLMDSHLYDYQRLSDEGRQRAMAEWIGEVVDTRGVAAVNWHQQVMSRDYGWAVGYRELLSSLAQTGVKAGPGVLP